MDPRDRADALLARARARRANIVTPDDATSPMDAMNTLQIPRAVVQASDSYSEHEVTMSIPGPAARARAEAEQRADAERNGTERNGTDGNGVAQATEETDPPTGPIPTMPEEQDTTRFPDPVTVELTDADRQAEERKPRTVEGLIPTVQEPSGRTSSLVERLRGHD